MCVCMWMSCFGETTKLASGLMRCNAVSKLPGNFYEDLSEDGNRKLKARNFPLSLWNHLSPKPNLKPLTPTSTLT